MTDSVQLSTAAFRETLHALVMPLESPQLDERLWQAWLEKNARQDRKFFRKVKIFGAFSAAVVLGLLL